MTELTEVSNAPSTPQRARNPITLGRAVFAVFVGFLVAQLLGQLAADVARSLTHAARDGQAAMDARVIVPSMLASEAGLLLVALIVPLTTAQPVRAALGLFPASLPVLAAAAVGTVMLGPLGDRLMSLLSQIFPDFTLGVVPALHELAQALPLHWLWPTFALLPGVAEELLFRGVLQRSVVNRRASILIAGCAFALFHVDPVHIVGVLPLGLFLSWVAARSCTTVSVFAHVVNNSLAIFSIHQQDLDVGFGTENELPIEWLIGSLVIFAFAAYSLVRLTRDSGHRLAPREV